MSHYLLLVVGDDPEGQLAIYDLKLKVNTFKQHLPQHEVERMADAYQVGPSDIDLLLNYMQDWTGFPGGIDDDGLFFWCSQNPRGKFDWYIMGGRWCGYLKLKHGAHGELGKRGAGIGDDDPLPYGDLSADQALYGDIDWYNMRRSLGTFAGDLYDSLDPADYWLHGVEPWMEREDYILERSHPATFALLKDSEWYERGTIGWWGVMLDANPVTEWHGIWDKLMADCRPETLITLIDCHIQGVPSG